MGEPEEAIPAVAEDVAVPAPAPASESRRFPLAAVFGLAGLLLLTLAYVATDTRYASTQFMPPRLLHSGDDYLAITRSSRNDRMLSIVLGIAMSDLHRQEHATGFIMPKDAAALSSKRSTSRDGADQPVVRDFVLQLFSAGGLARESYSPRVPSAALARALAGAKVRAYPRGVSTVAGGSARYMMLADETGERIYLVPESLGRELVRR